MNAAEAECLELRARVAELEAEVTEYGNKFVEAQQRVTELEAEREATGTEWGVRLCGLNHSAKSWGENEQGARRRVASFPDGRAELVNRTAPGPWQVAS